MSQGAPHPRMHGLTHVRGGPDPVPGLLPAPPGSFTDWVLALNGVWAYWPLQDASGDAIDLGPSHADMQPVGTPAYHAAGPNTTDLPFAVSLAGIPQTSIIDDSFYDAADELNMDSRSSLTAMCWIQPDPAATSRLPVIGTRDNFRRGWGLLIESSSRQLEFVVGDGSNGDFVLGPPITMGAWTFVAATLDDDTDTATLYVDGSEVASGSCPHFVGSGGIRVGALDFDSSGSDAYHFHGQMAGAVFVDHALTAGQILEGYHAGFTGGGMDPGDVLVVGDDGTPEWAPPGVSVEHGGGTPDATPAPIPPPSSGGGTSPGGWDTKPVEWAVLYDSTPGRFDVPSRKWVRVPFNTVRLMRSWETTPGVWTGAWLDDDRGLTEQAKNGLLHIADGMADVPDAVNGSHHVSGWFSFEWPVVDELELPNGGDPDAIDAYVRAGRFFNATTGQVVRAGVGAANPTYRRFFEWQFGFSADAIPEWVDAPTDNPYPIYPVWADRPLVLPQPYPKLTDAQSGAEYAPMKTWVTNNNLQVGDNLCMQVWQDSPWLIRFSTDAYRIPYPGLKPDYVKRPHLVVSYYYDPDTIDHTTGKVL